jgi:exonuclease III
MATRDRRLVQPKSALPLEREWFAKNDVAPNEQRLRVLSLNMLADGLAQGGPEINPDDPIFKPAQFAGEGCSGAGGVAMNFGVLHESGNAYALRCTAASLEWHRRWPQLRMLLLRHSPDVIGLQEVDLAGWGCYGSNGKMLPCHAEQIAYDLATQGYDGVFCRKGGTACDGLGLFWKTSRLGRRESHQVWPLGISVHVALAQPLVLWETGAEVLPVVTHLKAGLDAGSENVRFAQSAQLLEMLAHQASPVILLADLNAHCRPFNPRDGGPVEPIVYKLLSSYFSSAYRDVLQEEPDFTCWAGYQDRDVRGVFDYIFLHAPSRSNVKLRTLAVLRPPSGAEVLAAPTRLPHNSHPSDHIELIADVAISSIAEKPVLQPALLRRGRASTG